MHAHADSVYAISLKSSAAIWSLVWIFLPLALLLMLLVLNGLIMMDRSCLFGMRSDAAVDEVREVDVWIAGLYWLGANAFDPTRRDANRMFLYL